MTMLLVGGTALSLIAAASVHQLRARARADDLHRACGVAMLSVSNEARGLYNDLQALQSLYLASERVEPSEFAVFAGNLVARDGTRYYEWAPRVSREERAAFEAQAEGGIGAHITEQRDAVLVPAADRDAWFPVLFVVPSPARAVVVGFDLASEPARRRALLAARDTGRPSASTRVPLVQGGGGVLMMAPIFRGNPTTAAEREAAFEGVVVGVIQIDTMLANALAPMKSTDVVVSLVDPSAAPASQLLGQHPSAAPEATNTLLPEGRPGFAVNLELGTLGWELRCARASPGTTSLAAATGLFTFLAGFAVTALVAGYVRLLGGRAAEASAHAERLSREMAERKKAEAEVRAAEAEAASAGEMFRVVAEESGAGVYVLQDGRFKYANPKMAELFGREVAEIVDQLGPGDLLPSEPGVLVALSGVGAGVRPSLHLPGQRDAIVEVYTKPIVLHGLPAILGLLLDVTERRRIEAELNRSERLESLGLLAGGIAHDFNNLLTAITGNLALAELAVEPGSAAADRIESASRAVSRATGLTTQLQTFSRGGAPILAPTDLGDVLRDTTGFALRGATVACDLVVAKHLWTVEADANQISRVIHNLVINASQAMPNGGRIQVHASNVELLGDSGLPAGRYVEVTVTDTGVGMRPEVAAHIFDPYFTTRKTGSGLGLASAHSIVRRHGGSIEVTTAEGRGSTFVVRLPASRRPIVEDPAPAAPAPATGTVLVMDDDDAVRSVASGLLASLGYTVEETRDGAEAVALYAKRMQEGHPFTVVILDLTVPGGMGGAEAMKRLRELDPRVKGIASSGYSNDSTMSDAGSGFAGVLPKPYRRAELRAILERVIAGS